MSIDPRVAAGNRVSPFFEFVESIEALPIDSYLCPICVSLAVDPIIHTPPNKECKALVCKRCREDAEASGKSCPTSFSRPLNFSIYNISILEIVFMFNFIFIISTDHHESRAIEEGFHPLYFCFCFYISLLRINRLTLSTPDSCQVRSAKRGSELPGAKSLTLMFSPKSRN